MMKIIPSLELKALYYANKANWLSALEQVTDTILIRPEDEVGKAYRYGLSIHEYLKRYYKIDTKLKFMMDHGIFVTNSQFREYFHLDKTPETLLRIYDVLSVDYGLAYDIPARLHLQIALSPTEKLKRGLHLELKKLVEEISITTENESREKIKELSEKAVELTLKNLKEQLEIKSKEGYSFILIPSVQGIFKEDALRCLKESIDLLLSYNEKDLYVAIGTGGTRLKDEDAGLINELLVSGKEYARKRGAEVKFHLLGFSASPAMKKLRIDLIYSVDAVTVQRRAVEKKVYVIQNNELKLLPVSQINKESWNCKCPACTNFKDLVLEDSSKRENDVRMVHNLFVLKEYLEKESTKRKSIFSFSQF